MFDALASPLALIITGMVFVVFIIGMIVAVEIRLRRLRSQDSSNQQLIGSMTKGSRLAQMDIIKVTIAIALLVFFGLAAHNTYLDYKLAYDIRVCGTTPGCDIFGLYPEASERGKTSGVAILSADSNSGSALVAITDALSKDETNFRLHARAAIKYAQTGDIERANAHIARARELSSWRVPE